LRAGTNNNNSEYRVEGEVFMHGSAVFRWVLAGMLVFWSPPLLAEQGWEKAAEDADRQIVVYTRSVEGSPFKASRGVTTVEAALGAIVSLVSDADSYSEWMYNIKRSMLLEQVSRLENIIYIAQRFPWPVTDRDMVVYAKLHQDPDSKQIVITMKAVPGAYPEQDGHVRVTRMTGKWQLTPKGGNQVAVIYELHPDPGGYIPTRIANAYIVDTPLHTLRGLHRMIREPKYRDARLDTVMEP
jgi:hypothetical protein